jgi:hypothetical protein
MVKNVRGWLFSGSERLFSGNMAIFERLGKG